MNRFKPLSLLAFVRSAIALLFALSLSAATPSMIESARAHSAIGSFGCTVTGATVATPSVLTCASSHLVSGDLVIVANVGGTTTVNGLAYVSVSGSSLTLYSDAGLSVGITGTGAYTSGGTVSIAYDLSALVSGSDFTLTVRVDGLTANKKVALSIQDSADGFTTDIVNLATVNVAAGSAGWAGSGQTFTFRGYQLPSLRVGTTGARMRLSVQQIDGSATATVSFWISQ